MTDPPINKAYIQDTETRLRREIELLRKREDQLWKEFQELRAKNEHLKALLKAVVQEADRSTRAFDEARAELEGPKR